MKVVDNRLRDKLLIAKGLDTLKSIVEKIGISTITLRRILLGNQTIVRQDVYFKIIKFIKEVE